MENKDVSLELVKQVLTTYIQSVKQNEDAFLPITEIELIHHIKRQLYSE